MFETASASNGVKLALLEGQLLTREIDRATFIERAANLGLPAPAIGDAADKFMAIAANRDFALGGEILRIWSVAVACAPSCCGASEHLRASLRPRAACGLPGRRHRTAHSPECADGRVDISFQRVQVAKRGDANYRPLRSPSGNGVEGHVAAAPMLLASQVDCSGNFGCLNCRCVVVAHFGHS
jgi:hypothetical protein